MTNKVTLLDYGIGNVFSVKRALETVGAEVLLTDKPSDIENADRLVLPGVGAFADCMSNLRERGLIEPLLKFGGSKRPLLGICVGMQMLASVSEEFGLHEGLNLIPGRVSALPKLDKQGNTLKIPHVGWTKLHKADLGSWDDSPLGDTLEGEYVYVVHSFAVEPKNTEHRIAEYFYGEHAICAAIQHENIFGSQFHPEKSGPSGLRMLSRFLRC
jgi:imidazole glycerol-phosphate synthase subunit HisH